MYGYLPPPPPHDSDAQNKLQTESVALLGGLGNQMFQYAFMKGMQAAYPERCFRIDPYSDYSHLVHHQGFELLRVFGIPETDIICKSWAKDEEYLCRTRFYEDPCAQGALIFNKAVFKLRKNRRAQVFHGYWQSERYFAHISNEIRQLFRFPQLDAHNQVLADEIANTNSVVVHIRRGDYVNSLHDVLNIPYYHYAMRKMVRELPEFPIFYIFSNDENYCRQHLAKYEHTFQIRYISGNSGANSWKDMALMQKARHFIIANSSFSWWAAYLGEYKNKIVYAPRQWFLDFREGYFSKSVRRIRYEIRDICPKDWVLLDSLPRREKVNKVLLKYWSRNIARRLTRFLRHIWGKLGRE